MGLHLLKEEVPTVHGASSASRHGVLTPPGATAVLGCGTNTACRYPYVLLNGITVAISVLLSCYWWKVPPPDVGSVYLSNDGTVKVASSFGSPQPYDTEEKETEALLRARDDQPRRTDAYADTQHLGVAGARSHVGHGYGSINDAEQEGVVYVQDHHASSHTYSSDASQNSYTSNTSSTTTSLYFDANDAASHDGDVSTLSPSLPGTPGVVGAVWC